MLRPPSTTSTVCPAPLLRLLNPRLLIMPLDAPQSIGRDVECMSVSSRSSTRVFGRCNGVFRTTAPGGVLVRVCSTTGGTEPATEEEDFESVITTPGSVLVRGSIGRLNMGSGNGGGVGVSGWTCIGGFSSSLPSSSVSFSSSSVTSPATVDREPFGENEPVIDRQSPRA